MSNKILKKNEKLNLFLTVEMMITTLIIWFVCSKNGEVASDVFLISFVVLLLGLIGYIRKKFFEMDALAGLLILIVLFSGFAIVLNLSSNQKEISLENLRQWIIFISTICFFSIAEDMTVGKKTANVILGFNIIISFIYIFAKVFYPQPYSEFSSNFLTLNFDNPNLTGMFVFISILYMFLGFLYFENLILKGLCIILLISNITLLFETDSRNPLIALVLFLGLFLLCKFKSTLHFSKGFNLMVNISPSVFIFMYLTFIDAIIKSGWLDFLVSAGKSLSSRVKIWKYFLESLGNNWLLGDYANLSGNAHNSHLVLLCSFGLMVYILTIVFTYILVNRVSERIQNKFQFYSLAAFFAIIFMGFGEGALYSGGLGLYFLCGGFIILANSNLKED